MSIDWDIIASAVWDEDIKGNYPIVEDKPRKPAKKEEKRVLTDSVRKLEVKNGN